MRNNKSNLPEGQNRLEIIASDLVLSALTLATIVLTVITIVDKEDVAVFKAKITLVISSRPR